MSWNDVSIIEQHGGQHEMYACRVPHVTTDLKAPSLEKKIEVTKCDDQSYDRFDEDALSRMDDEGSPATNSRDTLKSLLWKSSTGDA